ncbi:GNAT family N-acetyltransferase [Micromonospora endolithica]|uniref:GNAT family N-acetyltransferase n=1 Tax=Micromonospora endolithica TaxID=230091 RepID=A0A3A9YTG2_9ACTN|nr:GNAT family N-acetyltransferase [Micromonospora endolithica]RKN39069.1 GNAT family N-acetyltransferase [Micromonospora endolithica]TWJ25566.1 ribosomal protein S18 acetylase RimI-like enzyme [Micromonospora endolithica]
MTSGPVPDVARPPSRRDLGGRRAPVRRIRPEDAARMRALRLEMLADAPLAFLETIADAAARPHAEYAARVARTSVGTRDAQFVADPGGRFVGHAGGTVPPDEPGLTVVYAIYVTPSWRGTGLLGDLIEAVADWSRAGGRPELMLEVVVGNDRAFRAYQRLGFTDTGVRVPHPTVPALTELQMRRPA